MVTRRGVILQQEYVLGLSGVWRADSPGRSQDPGPNQWQMGIAPPRLSTKAISSCPIQCFIFLCLLFEVQPGSRPHGLRRAVHCQLHQRGRTIRNVYSSVVNAPFLADPLCQPFVLILSALSPLVIFPFLYV